MRREIGTGPPRFTRRSAPLEREASERRGLDRKPCVLTPEATAAQPGAGLLAELDQSCSWEKPEECICKVIRNALGCCVLTLVFNRHSWIQTLKLASEAYSVCGFP